MRAVSEQEACDILESFVPELWALSIIFFGVGDLVTTHAGLLSGWAAEVGPLAVVAINEFGLLATIPLKVGTFLACYAAWRWVPRPHALGVPLGLAVTGILVTSWNLFILLLAAFHQIG